MASRARRHTTPRRNDTSDPSRSRERALRVLFQADLRDVAPTITLQRLDADPEARSLLDEREDLTEEVPILPFPTAGASSPIDPAAARSARGARDTRGGNATPDAQAARPTPDAQAARPTPDAQAARPAPGAADNPGASGSRDAGRSSGWTDAPTPQVPAEIDGFTRALVQGVEEHRVAVEALITRYSRRWAIPRMPVVDRNILRLATYELLHEPTPPAVVIDEAVGLAKRLSTDDSGRFVNGVLESIRKDIVSSQVRAQDPEG